MIARVVIQAGVRPGDNLNALSEEAFGDETVSVVLLLYPPTIPDQQPVRHFAIIHKLSNFHQPASAIVAEFNALVSGIDCRQPVSGVPFVCARSGGSRAGAKLVQSIVGGGICGRPHLLRESVGSR